MHSWGVWTLQSDPNLKKIVLIKALQWLLILLFLYFFHFVMATKVFGTQKFSLFLSLPLCGCVCYTCVSIPAFKSMICFIFFLSFTVGKVSVLYTLLAVSPASAPLPSPQQSLISIWGSGVPGMLILLPPPDLVTICWKAFDCSFSYSEQKTPVFPPGCKAWCSPALLRQPHLLQPPHPLCTPLHGPPCFSLNMPGTFMSPNMLPPFGL